MNNLFFTNNLQSLVLPLLLSLSSGVCDAQAAQVEEVVDVKLTHVFVAREGFDDNDNVQAVVRGELPNACYLLGQSKLEINLAQKLIFLEQSAIIDRSGVCAKQETLPPELSQPISFVRELNFGALPASEYSIVFQSADGEKLRTFEVGLAPTDTVDSARYALITNAFVQDVVERSSGALEFRITGYINSSCAELSEFSIKKVDDVYVLLPKVNVKGEYCMPVNKPFYRMVTLEPPEAGFYLLHARSLAGQASNKVFQVKE